MLLPGSTSPWWYCQHIADVSVQAKCLLRHLYHWPGYGCQDALKAVLGHHHQKVSAELETQLQEMLHKISVYEKVMLSSCCLLFSKIAGINLA
jgi:hypothetical protein